MQGLWWLPDNPDWANQLAAAQTGDALVALSKSRMDFVQTLRLDRKLQRATAAETRGLKPLRLAILSSSTADHLAPSLRIAALRRRILLDVYQCPFGQYQQDLANPASGLHAFKPDVVLFSFDAQHLVGNDPAATAARLDDEIMRISDFWEQASGAFRAQVIQQTLLPTPQALVGGNEHRFAGSPLRLVNAFNERLRAAATQARVDILAIDEWAMRRGLDSLYDAVLWHRAKQEISPTAAPLYGDLVMRAVGARLGLSGKCLVLDLDNTLWGGVIGDDGLQGIVLGQGSALGESYLDFQRYAKGLTRRGVILAVCSKNDSSNAMEVFEKHPEMHLRADDFAAFRINWQDKASNLRELASELSIGLDALVFADDNPFERDLVRAETPAVMTPELPEDPALYARCLAESGYFDIVEVTEEDAQRARLYVARGADLAARANTTDLAGYLAGLEMKLQWSPFRSIDLQRITQLANKTNQFNLRTQRYVESDIKDLIDRPDALTLQLRLVDRLADHGIISLLIGRLDGDGVLDMETWLMSCRVLGRAVEEATANLVFAEARRLGAHSVRGEYLRTAKNNMVEDLYSRLGFSLQSQSPDRTVWIKTIAEHQPMQTPITEVRV